MAIDVRQVTASDTAAINRLNIRLAAAGLRHRLADRDPDQVDWTAPDAKPISARLYLAADGQEIRGGVWLREQCFWSDRGAIRAGWAVYPVAESLIDGHAAGVPAGLLFKLLRQQSHLMALGMGGHTGAFAKLLAAARFPGSSVPFLFRLLRPSRVLRRLSIARSTPVRRALADGLAYSGLAWVGNNAVTTARMAIRRRPSNGCTTSVVDRFGDWTDDVWQRAHRSYGLIAFRDCQSLNALYPDDFKALVRLRVQREGNDVGWVIARWSGTCRRLRTGRYRNRAGTTAPAAPRCHG